MKNILFLTWKDIKHPRKGGAEVVIFEYAKRLVKEGNRVIWFASNFPNGQENETIEGIEIIRKYSINTIYFFSWKWYKDFSKNNKIDIIIDEAGGIPLLSPLYEKKIPIYFLIHHIGEKEYDDAFFFPLNKIFKKFVFWTFSLYKNFETITVSESTKQELEEKFGFTKVKVVENAVNLTPIEKINFSDKKNEIVFLGRITPMKRVHETIEIFAKFSEKNPDYFLNIIGNRQDEKYALECENLIKTLGGEQKINFIDYSPENVKKYLTSAKIMLVTSTKEGFGLVVLEGNCYGLPVLSYDVPGLRDSVKNRKNGFLIEDNNQEKFAEKLQEILQNEENYQKIANSSLEYIKNFGNWDDKFQEFKKIIKM